MSAFAGPESGLTSSMTESWAGPEPTPANHWVDEGTLQPWAVIGEVPNRRPRRPGASSPSPWMTAGPGPVSGVTAPVETDRVELSEPAPTLTSPDAPLAVDTHPADALGSADGQTSVELVSLVRAGAWVVSCTGGFCTSARTPTVTSGITSASALMASKRGVRRRRTTSATRTRLPGLIRAPRGEAVAENCGEGWSCVVLLGTPA